MLRFIDTPRQTPPKREAAERTGDFLEIYREFIAEKAEEQAARCSQCGVPFCQVHCPLHNNIPDWLKLTAEGRLREAYELSSATNSFPEICGRICPQDRLCEGNCVIEQSRHGTVTIGSVERYITERAFAEGWVVPRRPLRERSGSVGIVGAGPGGLAAAEMLRAEGWQVTVYDRHDRAGGLMIYGIPGFKLEKTVMLRRAALLEAQGVRFQLNTEIGRDVTFGDLRTRHHAVLIATGVHKARALQAPGVGGDGLIPALDYLTASNRIELGDTLAPEAQARLNAKGRAVVVVGGGDTAMDCVRTAVRQGARSVTCLYRRDRANMPGSRREVDNAEEEGVVFRWLAAPEGFVTDEAGRLTGVLATQMELGLPDASGRREPQPIPGSRFKLEADLAIAALGFDPEDLPSAFGEPDLPVSRWGTLLVDHQTMKTRLPHVWAAGDIVRGASLVVWAIRDGRTAALSIHNTLAQREAADATALEAA